jgi:hypothetical protein
VMVKVAAVPSGTNDHPRNDEGREAY